MTTTYISNAIAYSAVGFLSGLITGTAWRSKRKTKV